MVDTQEGNLSSTAWEILLIDDDQDDFFLTRDALDEIAGSRIRLRWSASYEEGLQALAENQFNAVLVDYRLAQHDGIDLIREAIQAGYNLPFILLTGQSSYEVDLAAMQAGAVDYISKKDVNPLLLERSLRYAIERHRLLEENRQERILFQTVFEVNPDGLAVVTGDDMVFRLANPAYRKLTPDPALDPLGRSVDEVWAPVETFQASQALRYIIDTQEVVRVDRHDVVFPDGNAHSLAFHLQPYSWQGRPAVLIVLWEVTALEEARARAEKAAEDSARLLRVVEQQRARLTAIIENAPVGILVADAQARILMANPASERMLGGALPLNQEIPLGCMMASYPDGIPYDTRNQPLARSALDGEVFENLEMLVTLPNGQRRDWLFNAAPIHGENGERQGAVAIFQDITEHRRTADILQRNAAQMEAQRYLTRSRELERLTIAHDLHDGPLQEMIGVTFRLSEALALADDAELAELITTMQSEMQSLIAGVRSFCNELRPPALAPFGLERAIRSHAESFRALHPELDLELQLEPDGQALPEAMRMTLFQVFRESLNNIVKHAQASQVGVRFTIEEGEAVLEVRDNGRGFLLPYHWVEFARQGHLGLVGMQERIEAVGGAMHLVSAPGQGTRLRVRVPLVSEPALIISEIPN